MLAKPCSRTFFKTVVTSARLSQLLVISKALASSDDSTNGSKICMQHSNPILQIGKLKPGKGNTQKQNHHTDSAGMGVGFSFSLFLFFFSLSCCGVEARASHTLGGCCLTEPHNHLRLNFPKDLPLGRRGKRQSSHSVETQDMSLECRHPQTHKDDASCQRGPPPLSSAHRPLLPL